MTFHLEHTCGIVLVPVPELQGSFTSYWGFYYSIMKSG